MEFKVVNRDTGDFLGNLTVDSVEPNEATGRLDGPRVSDIKPGVEVKQPEEFDGQDWTDENRKNDMQLHKAIEILKTRLAATASLPGRPKQ